MDFQSFVASLEHDVDWTAHTRGDVARIEQLITEFARDGNAVATAIRHLLSDTDRFASYLPHVEYPRPFMDKFLLYMDPRDRFRIRLHRFRAGTVHGIGAAHPTIHDHRWHFTSRILLGHYSETIFDALQVTDTTWELKPRSSRQHLQGSTYSLAPGILHQTVNDGEHPCLTLFVRGRSVTAANRVWNPAESRFTPLLTRSEQVADQMHRISTALLSRDANLARPASLFS